MTNKEKMSNIFKEIQDFNKDDQRRFLSSAFGIMKSCATKHTNALLQQELETIKDRYKMKREDFFEIKPYHFITCKKMLVQNGCSSIDCKVCPFFKENCPSKKFSCQNTIFAQLPLNAKEFLKFEENNG